MPKSKAPVRVEKQEFEMDPGLLYDVIRRQAGTLAKAILELVMNSVDAGASRCDIAIDSEAVLVEDDGSGFPTKEHIAKFFKRFGTPHTADENKIYGNFRMGRGQAFAFGRNVWRSGEFEMDVDVPHRGLAWQLKTGLLPVKGCHITIKFESKLLPSELAETIREVEKCVKYVNIPVTLNDRVISSDPAKLKWDYTSDNCFVRLKERGCLDVYNLGVFVCSISDDRYGRGGVVVSRQQLKLNFARNDVLVRECAVWKEVHKFVRSQADREIASKPKNTQAERAAVCRRLAAGDFACVTCDKPQFITDVNGRHYSLGQLWAKRDEFPVIAFAEIGHRLADKIHQQKRAFVLAKETLEFLSVDSATQAVALLQNVSDSIKKAFWFRDRLKNWPEKSLVELVGKDADKYQILDDKELTPNEKLWLAILQHRDVCARSFVGYSPSLRVPRRIVIGMSKSADGWTDGVTYIAINRRFLASKKWYDVGALVAVMSLLAHEYCHDGPDSDTHTHSPEFYQAFHDICARRLGYAVQRAYNVGPRMAEKLGVKLGAYALAALDKRQRVASVAATDTAARKS